MSNDPIWRGRKSASITITMTDAEKDNIKEAAKSLKYTMSEYLLGLHHEKASDWKPVELK